MSKKGSNPMPFSGASKPAPPPAPPTVTYAHGKVIPILRGHDPMERIGIFENGIVTLDVPLLQDQLFTVFGNVGVRIIESAVTEIGNDAKRLVTKVQIMEWSI